VAQAQGRAFFPWRSRTRPSFTAPTCPYLRGGGIFVPTNRRYTLGDEVFLLLSLPDDKDRLPVAGKVVWITPPGSGNRAAGIGVQFSDSTEAENGQGQDRDDAGRPAGVGQADPHDVSIVHSAGIGCIALLAGRCCARWRARSRARIRADRRPRASTTRNRRRRAPRRRAGRRGHRRPRGGSAGTRALPVALADGQAARRNSDGSVLSSCATGCMRR
jgi:Tfp pilus assembly protein PilZ